MVQEVSSVPQREEMRILHRADEFFLIPRLIEQAALSEKDTLSVQNKAIHFMENVRNARKSALGLESFLADYSLSSEEGLALMCLAEALLRIPDKATVDHLIKDKLGLLDWHTKRKHRSLLMSVATWGLVLTGKCLTPEKADSLLEHAFQKILKRGGENLVRKVIYAAMRFLSKQFVMGRNIEETLMQARKKEALGYRFSYDMLGEAALTKEDAERYFLSYQNAIERIGQAYQNTSLSVYQKPGISIKLSALHPRYQEEQKERINRELTPKLLALAEQAKAFNIGLIIDAEESERLELSLDLIEAVFTSERLNGWEGFGIAIQSYQKRALAVLDFAKELAQKQDRRMMVRLIKGAYWDSEIKKAQMQGLEDYPVFTRKTYTDVSFQACVKKLFSMTKYIYPQFATHNAYSVAMILNCAGDYRDFEFQALYGMGQALYDHLLLKEKIGIACRIYAPIGSYEDLLPYLVRRLLENGANSSFVNQILDEGIPLQRLSNDPLQSAAQTLLKKERALALPSAIFLPERQNSKGFDFSNRSAVTDLKNIYQRIRQKQFCAQPLIANHKCTGTATEVVSPACPEHKIGQVIFTTPDDVEVALSRAKEGFLNWGQSTVAIRKHLIERYASLLEQHKATLLGLLVLEAGKTWQDANAEIREAIDFCYYYSSVAMQLLSSPKRLTGYTGELNELCLCPRGLIVCISPWNFPLAIFTGQIIASLVTGNCVIAKPAEQTSILASYAVQLMHEAGIPQHAVQLLPGKGEKLGPLLMKDKRVNGVLFTGGTETAASIYKVLANRGGEMIPFIAETGGQNAMIVDSSALLEQVTTDILLSAFGSAGQRCSALRVLFVQEDIYPRMRDLLCGAMAELRIGDPADLATDIGPVIDEQALLELKKHIRWLKKNANLIYACDLPKAYSKAYFCPPMAFEIPDLSCLKKEVFGPLLHVIPYQEKKLNDVIQQINQTGYGLTLGIHSRINATIEKIHKAVHVGNCYVNRSMTGAVVGLQPFGGEGLSGTGPKAGGPYYLLRLCHERTFTVDTTAAGGNASLMMTQEGY